MKVIVPLFVLAILPAIAVTVSVLPESEFADTEVSTNVAFNATRSAASNECGTCFSALSASVPSWLYGKDWNLMKVTRRGVDTASENIEVECQYKFFYITIR